MYLIYTEQIYCIKYDTVTLEIIRFYLNLNKMKRKILTEKTKIA